MIFSNNPLVSLGTFTWANLQVAYPNGGGALAALPAGATAVVTGIGKAPCLMWPNSAKTRWVPVNGRHVLLQAGGTLPIPLFTWAGTTGVFTPAGGAVELPANVLAAGDFIHFQSLTRKRNANATATFAARIGTTGTVGADSAIVADTITNIDLRDYRPDTTAAMGDTSWNASNWLPPMTQNTGVFVNRTTGYNRAALMYCWFEISAINALDFVDLISIRFSWETAF
jgi:hypothetical protein